MKYYVPMKKMEQYLNLEIGDNDLFPNDAPIGTSFYDLEPENDIYCVVKVEHLRTLLRTFLEGAIDDERVKAYVETLYALDLFIFDDTTDEIHDLISHTIFTLDELKDVNGEITKENAVVLLEKLTT